jgi:hypothetical protein
MRRMLKAALMLGMIVGLSGRVAAQDDPKELIRKAIAAHGGADLIEKYKGSRTSSKGTISVQGMELEFTSDGVSMDPDKQKTTLKLEVGGMSVTVVQLSNGDKFSMVFNGMAVPLQDAQKSDMKSSVELHKIMNLTPLISDKSYEIKMLPPIKVDEKEAVGIEVSNKEIKGVKVYFDKATNLIIKTEHKGLDPATGMGEVVHEIVLSDYKDVKGIKHPMKTVATADGKKFMENTTTKIEVFEKIDDSEFSD